MEHEWDIELDENTSSEDEEYENFSEENENFSSEENENFSYRLWVVAQHLYPEYPLATVLQVRENSSWKGQVRAGQMRWTIATLADGYCNGEGYGLNVFEEAPNFGLGHKVISIPKISREDCLTKPSTVPVPFPTTLPTLPAEMWRRILGFLSPVQQWEVEDTFHEFQNAVSYDLEEVVASKKRAIDLLNGAAPGTLEPWITQNGPDVKSFSHILSENRDNSKTLGVTHLPQYLDWAEDIHLETRILKLREVCWLDFCAQLKLPKGRFNIYFKMKRGLDLQDPNNRWNDNNNIQNDYRIILNGGSDDELVGFLYNIANISKSYWSWVPVCTSSAQSMNIREMYFFKLKFQISSNWKSKKNVM